MVLCNFCRSIAHPVFGIEICIDEDTIARLFRCEKDDEHMFPVFITCNEDDSETYLDESEIDEQDKENILDDLIKLMHSNAAVPSYEEQKEQQTSSSEKEAEQNTKRERRMPDTSSIKSSSPSDELDSPSM